MLICPFKKMAYDDTCALFVDDQKAELMGAEMLANRCVLMVMSYNLSEIDSRLNEIKGHLSDISTHQSE